MAWSAPASDARSIRAGARCRPGGGLPAAEQSAENEPAEENFLDDRGDDDGEGDAVPGTADEGVEIAEGVDGAEALFRVESAEEVVDFGNEDRDGGDDGEKRDGGGGGAEAGGTEMAPRLAAAAEEQRGEQGAGAELGERLQRGIDGGGVGGPAGEGGDETGKVELAAEPDGAAFEQRGGEHEAEGMTEAEVRQGGDRGGGRSGCGGFGGFGGGKGHGGTAERGGGRKDRNAGVRFPRGG